MNTSIVTKKKFNKALITVFIISSIIQIITANPSQTDSVSCVRCYANGHTHCLDEALLYSECGEFEDDSEEQTQWMGNFRYCTKNVIETIYKLYTCPGEGCPAGAPHIIELTEMDKEETIQVDWGHFENAYHCKVLIRAKSGPQMNGKISMEIINNEDANSFVYLQPNDFNEVAGTHGLLENEMIYQNQKSGIFEVPTDWSITLTYNVGYFKGDIQLRVKATNYVDADKENILNKWQPTGTYHFTADEEAAQEAELDDFQDARIRELEKQIKDMNRSAEEQERLLEEARLKAQQEREDEKDRRIRALEEAMAENQKNADLNIVEGDTAVTHKYNTYITENEGFVFNTQWLIILISVVVYMFCCAGGFFVMVMRHYSKKKEEIMNQMLINQNAPMDVIQGQGIDDYDEDESDDDPWAYSKAEGKQKGMKKKRFRTNAQGMQVMDFYGNQIEDDDGVYDAQTVGVTAGKSKGKMENGAHSAQAKMLKKIRDADGYGAFEAQNDLANIGAIEAGNEMNQRGDDPEQNQIRSLHHKKKKKKKKKAQQFSKNAEVDWNFANEENGLIMANEQEGQYKGKHVDIEDVDNNGRYQNIPSDANETGVNLLGNDITSIDVGRSLDLGSSGSPGIKGKIVDYDLKKNQSESRASRAFPKGLGMVTEEDNTLTRKEQFVAYQNQDPSREGKGRDLQSYTSLSPFQTQLQVQKDKDSNQKRFTQAAGDILGGSPNKQFDLKNIRGPGEAPTDYPGSVDNDSMGIFGSAQYPDRDRSKADHILDNMPNYNKYDPSAREPKYQMEGLDFGAEELLNRGLGKKAAERTEEVKIIDNNYSDDITQKMGKDGANVESGGMVLAGYSGSILTGAAKGKRPRVPQYVAPDAQKKPLNIYDRDVEVSEMELENLQNELGDGFGAELEYQNQKKEANARVRQDTFDSNIQSSSGGEKDFF